MSGSEIIRMCQEHVLNIMRSLPDCQPSSEGLGNRDIEAASDLALALAEQDGWFTWSILHSLIRNGLVEKIAYQHGKLTRYRYRLIAVA